MSEIDRYIEAIAHRVCLEMLERARAVAPAVQTEWMTELELAAYWQLRNADGQPTMHSIRKWTARPENEHPLPCAQMGEMRRYHRSEVDRWAREEAEHRRRKRSESRLQAIN
jgi:hypothetical protein